MNDENLAKSIKQKLLSHGKKVGEDFNLVQIKFATERLLYRLSVSKYKEDFFLKGAMLFVIWDKSSHRPTKDMDILFLSSKDMDELKSIFQDVLKVEVEFDALVFDADSIQVNEIREANAYGGVRILMNCTLLSSKIQVQVDVGIGDSVHPRPVWTHFPTILDMPSPLIRPYPIYTVIAEKFHAMVHLGLLNSRMKDYYDLFSIAKSFTLNGADLLISIEKTFEKRKTLLPELLPVGLGYEFYSDSKKQKQWKSFLRKNHIQDKQELETVVMGIQELLYPITTTELIQESTWYPDNGWQ